MNRKKLEEMLKGLDIGKLKALRDVEADDVLELVGLQRRGTDWTTAVTALGVGILVGAGLGLLLAPKSGQALREDLRERIAGDETPEPRSIGHRERPTATPR